MKYYKKSKYNSEKHKILSFYVDIKKHEDFKIRLYYDSFKSQSRFFEMCIESYLERDENFMKFLDVYKVENNVQSKTKNKKVIKERFRGTEAMKKLALTEDDIENILDILEDEISEI